MKLVIIIALLAAGETPTANDEARCVTVAQTPDLRVVPNEAISPGLPPLFAFRFYEGKLHGRFNNADLVLDDAGH